MNPHSSDSKFHHQKSIRTMSSHTYCYATKQVIHVFLPSISFDSMPKTVYTPLSLSLHAITCKLEVHKKELGKTEYKNGKANT